MSGEKKRPGMFELKQPFYRPLWLRVLLVVLCIGWGAMELYSGSPFWGVLFGGIGLYCAWVFFLSPGRSYFSQVEDDADSTDKTEKPD